MANKPWKQYGVGTPSQTNWVNPDCQRLNTVTHVTHIANALSIIPRDTLEPQLVKDESLMNTRRTLVNWASPNYWSNGSRYGNVAFKFDWQTLTQGRRSYWVEVMGYNVAACRILITDKNYDADPELTPYDPTAGDGPWWWDTSKGTHYWNGEICLEFMLEFQLSPSSCKELSFVDHHPQYCCINASSCPDKGIGHQEASARFLAAILSEGIDLSRIPIDDIRLRGGWGWLSIMYPKNGYPGPLGGVDATDASAPALARSVLSAYSRGKNEDFTNLAKAFSSRSALESAVHALMAAKFPNLRNTE